MRAKRSRSAIIFVVGAVASGALVAVACSFPEVTFVPGANAEGGPAVDGSTTDASDDAFRLIDGSDPDALVEKDAGSAVDAAGCDASDCDCDKDTFKDLTKAGCTTPGVDAGAADCDDNDPRARPGRGYLDIPPVAPTNGNWNCVNGVEKLYTPNLDCTKLAPGSACESAVGFEDDPPCGDKGGVYMTCKTVADLGVLQKCVSDIRKLGRETQACK